MKQLRIGEFAQRAGVTTRTLRYYDRLGLLQPSAYSDTGQRLYTEPDTARLQQILTLKLIGLSLDEIRQLLTTETTAIGELLERQKRVLAQQVSQLEAVILTIEKAQHSLQSSQQLDWETFVNIIRAVNMNTQSNWADQFFTPEQQQKIAARGSSQTLHDQKQAGEAWRALFADIQRAMNQDAQDAAAHQLVDRWDALMEQFSEGDSDFAASLNRAYTLLPVDAPPEIQTWVDGLQQAAQFIQRLRDERR
jgi:DNA-binding transcriptional MerR regulator